MAMLPRGSGGITKEEIAQGMKTGIDSSLQNSQDLQLNALNKLVDLMSRMVEIQEGILDEAARQRLAAFRQLEAQRESQRGGAGGPGVDAGKADGPNKIALILAGIAALVTGFFTGIIDSVKKLLNLTKLDKLFGRIGNLFKAEGAIGKLFVAFRSRWATFADNAIKFVDDLLQPLKTFFSADGGMGRFIKGITNTFRSTFTGAAKIFDDLIQPFKGLLSAEGVVGKRITGLFRQIVSIFTFPFEGVIDDIAKPLKNIFANSDEGVLKRIFGAIVRPFRAGLTFIESLIEPIKVFFSADGPISKAFSVVTDAFKIFAEGSEFMKVLGGIGKVIGRLFVPFTVLMTAYDTIKGMIKGFEEDGFLGGLQGAIEGFLNSVVGAPLDLVKDIVSWVLKKFGFDNASEALDKFSFQDIIGNVVDSIFDLFKMVVNGFLEAVATVIDAIPIPGTGKAAEGIRSMKLDLNARERGKAAEELEAAEAKEVQAKKTAKQAEKKARVTRNAAREGGLIVNGRRLEGEEAEAYIESKEGKAQDATYARDDAIADRMKAQINVSRLSEPRYGLSDKSQKLAQTQKAVDDDQAAAAKISQPSVTTVAPVNNSRSSVVNQSVIGKPDSGTDNWSTSSNFGFDPTG